MIEADDYCHPLPINFCLPQAALPEQEPRPQTSLCIRFWVSYTSYSKQLCRGSRSQRRSFCFPFSTPPIKIKQEYYCTKTRFWYSFWKNKNFNHRKLHLSTKEQMNLLFVGNHFHYRLRKIFYHRVIFYN